MLTGTMRQLPTVLRSTDRLPIETLSIVAYGAAGLVGTTVHFAVLFATVGFAGPVLASTLGALCGCVVNYFLARHVVFANAQAREGSFRRFVTVAVIGVAINAAVIRVLVDAAPLALYQAIASASVFLIGYTLNRYWTFHACKD